MLSRRSRCVVGEMLSRRSRCVVDEMLSRRDEMLRLSLRRRDA